MAYQSIIDDGRHHRKASPKFGYRIARKKMQNILSSCTYNTCMYYLTLAQACIHMQLHTHAYMHTQTNKVIISTANYIE